QMQSPEHLVLRLEPNMIATLDILQHIKETWWSSICVSVAAFWFIYRIYGVLSKPVDELISLLGLEVPVAPTISLAGIKADGIILHWKPPDPRSTVNKHQVHINGINVGEVSQQETSVTVSGLKPACYYTVRVVATNATFNTASEPIRFQTKPSTSSDWFTTPSEHDESDDDENEEEDHHGPTPTVRPYKPFLETIQPSSAAPAMAREHSGSISQSKRGAAAVRRVASSATVPDQATQDSAENEGTVRQLTERLESLRRENEDTEKQTQEEENEHAANKDALIKERDDLKHTLQEKESVTKDLKKQVDSLQRAHTQASARRTQKERVLQEKQKARKKIQDDMERWDKEVEEMRAEVHRMEEEKVTHREATEEKIKELREKLVEEQNNTRRLEDDIHAKGLQIKSLEEEKQKRDTGEDADASEERSVPDTLDGDPQFHARLRDLQTRYATAWGQLQQAEAAYKFAQEHLRGLQRHRQIEPQKFAATPTLESIP
ncbi:hypothetical protein LTS18_012286, partial [Coniosporium uncinatum]